MPQSQPEKPNPGLPHRPAAQRRSHRQTGPKIRMRQKAIPRFHVRRVPFASHLFAALHAANSSQTRTKCSPELPSAMCRRSSRSHKRAQSCRRHIKQGVFRPTSSLTDSRAMHTSRPQAQTIHQLRLPRTPQYRDAHANRQEQKPADQRRMLPQGILSRSRSLPREWIRPA